MKNFIPGLIALFAISQTNPKHIKSNTAASWSCVDKCRQNHFMKDASCQCNAACERYHNCCDDYRFACMGKTSDEELARLSEHLFYLDELTHTAQNIQINPQRQVSFQSQDDVAPHPLLQVNLNEMSNPALEVLHSLYNVFIPEVNVPEINSAEKDSKISSFINVMLQTPIVKHLQEFLTSKNISIDEQTIRNVWFVPYSRGKHGKGSSGFEHVFMGELNSGRIAGFHNWIYFAHQENLTRLNYRGYQRLLPLNGNRFLITANVDWLGSVKNGQSFFIGTSPQFELSIYTLCVIARPNNKCRINLNGHKIQIQSWLAGSQVGSAYPHSFSNAFFTE